MLSDPDSLILPQKPESIRSIILTKSIAFPAAGEYEIRIEIKVKGNQSQEFSLTLAI
jgi:hypothetical protein